MKTLLTSMFATYLLILLLLYVILPPLTSHKECFLNEGFYAIESNSDKNIFAYNLATVNSRVIKIVWFYGTEVEVGCKYSTINIDVTKDGLLPLFIVEGEGI